MTEQRDEENLTGNEITEVQLGDRDGNDSLLNGALSGIEEEVNAASSGNWKITEFLTTMWFEYCVPGFRKSAEFVAEAVMAYTRKEERLLRAQGDVETQKIESEAKLITANAEAEKTLSEGIINEAEARRIDAETEAIRAAEARKDKLLEFLMERGIDMAAEQRDGILRIAFDKKDGHEGSE